MTEKVKFINENKNKYTITLMCEVLRINRKTYYKYRNNFEDPDLEDANKILEVFQEGKEMYGVLKLKKGLKEKFNIVMNHKKIRRIKQKFDIYPKYMKIFKPNVRQKVRKENIKKNLLEGDFTVIGENQKWVTDITYLIGPGEKRSYMCSIMDLYTKNIIAYSIDNNMGLPLVIKTLNKAIYQSKGSLEGLIIHSDQGAQYTSIAYQKICLDNKIEVSMSRPGKPSDNAPIESFHACLKRETIHSHHYFTHDQYVRAAKEWIEFYNNDRIRLAM